MSLKSKFVFLLVAIAAVFSSNTRKLIDISMDAKDRGSIDGEHPTGATCN